MKNIRRVMILVSLCIFLCLPMLPILANSKVDKAKNISTKINAVKPKPYFACDSGGQGSTGCSASGNGCSISCGAGYYSCCIGSGTTSNCSCIKGGEPEQ